MLVKQSRAAQAEPQIGLFWLVNGKLVIDGTPLSEAEEYRDHVTHPRSHLEVWTLFQRNHTVPNDLEYEESPRGRVTYNAKTQRFTLLADKCIFQDKNVVRKIISEMNLPSKDTDTGTDTHYRCSVCLQGETD